MDQQLNLGHSDPCKTEPLILNPHDPLCNASVPYHSSKESEKGDSAAFDPASHSLEDCPDGGLRAWLVVLGVRISTIDEFVWTVTENVLGFMCQFCNVSRFRYATFLGDSRLLADLAVLSPGELVNLT